MSFRMARRSAFAVGGLLLGWGLWRLLHRPTDLGAWSPDQAAVIAYTTRGDSVTISNVRDADPATRAPHWGTRTVDLAGLDSVWLVVAPFSEGWRGPAHIFVTFGLGGGEYLSVSVEARRAPAKEYSVFAGTFDQYEVIYIVGTERDLIGRRVHDAEGPVYLYPIRATPAAIRTLFTSMLARGAALKTHPEFYNTLTNNCTSNLIAHVQPLVDRRIPSAFVSVMPGYADAVAKGLDLIGDNADIGTIRARYRIDGIGRPALDSADFSSLIRRTR